MYIENETLHLLLEKVIYFSIFNHPLKKSELITLSSISSCELDHYLTDLENKQVIQIEQEYVLLKGFSNLEDVTNRQHYESIFDKMKPHVLSNSKFIAKFPFVKSIAISGSMSKGVVKEDGDVDFFIITADNRLWICRTLLIIFKKIFRLNSHKFFCLNYFISESNLTIPDQNIFTSTELAYLSPTFGEQLFQNLLQKNSWYSDKFPNNGIRIDFGSVSEQSFMFKSFIEKIFSSSLGEWLDKKCLRLTVNRWNKKFPSFSSTDMELTMRSKRNVSKHHPSNFQKRVLKEMETRKNTLFPLLDTTVKV